MVSVIDSLSIELGWDTRKFFDGARETEARVKSTREDFERTSKVWDATIGSLIRTLGGLVTAFLSVEAAIRGIEWTKGASQAGSEMSNLAAATGVSITKLGEWEQALKRVGGRGNEAGQAFALQQSEFQKTRGPRGGVPFGENAAWLQRLRLGHYFDKSATSFDPDAFNRELFEKIRSKSAAERQQILEAFGFSGNAPQAMAGQPVGPQLDRQRATAITKENEETFNRLQALWTDLGNTAESVYRNLTTYLETPLKSILTIMTEVMAKLNEYLTGKAPLPGIPAVTGGISVPSNVPGSGVDWSLGFRQSPLGTSINDWFDKHKGTGGVGVDWSGGAKRIPGGGVGTDWRAPLGETKSLEGAGINKKWAPTLPPPTLPLLHPGSAPAASAPPAPETPPVSFEDRFSPAMGPRSSIDMSRRYAMLMDLPRSARASIAAPVGGSTATNSQSSVTIGAMTFNSRSSDSAMGHAPSDVAKDLSVASYSVHANDALE